MKIHFEFEWARFAEQVRRRELPGSARREAQEQAEFEAASKQSSRREAASEFYAQFTDTPPSPAASCREAASDVEAEQWPES